MRAASKINLLGRTIAAKWLKTKRFHTVDTHGVRRRKVIQTIGLKLVIRPFADTIHPSGSRATGDVREFRDDQLTGWAVGWPNIRWDRPCAMPVVT